MESTRANAVVAGKTTPALNKRWHGGGKPLHKQIDEQADIYQFLFAYLPRKTASAQQGRLHI